MGCEGGVSELFLRVQSYSFGHLVPHAKFQNHSLPPSGRFMVGDKFQRLYWMLQRLYCFHMKIIASLAPARAEVGAEAKADQK